MQSVLTFIAVIAVILVLCLMISTREQRQEEEKLRSRLLHSFGQIPTESMSAQRYERVPARYLRHRPEDGIDDITWNDLDMDLLYARINCTRSGAGEEYLYALLRSPIRKTGRHEDSVAPAGEPLAGDSTGPSPTGPHREEDTASGSSISDEDISLRQIRWFEDDSHTEVRLRLQLALSRFGHAGRYSIYEYLDALDAAQTESILRHLPAFLLPLASLAILFVNVPAGVLCLIGSLVLNMLTYYRRRGEVEPYIVSFSWLLRMLQCADEVLEIPCDAISKEQARLRRLQPAFSSFRRGSWILLSGTAVSGGSIFDFVMDYIRILFHLDLIKFNTMLSEARHLLPEIDEELSLLGRIDTAICLASFEKSLPVTCEPVLHDQPEQVPFAVKGLYHPLLEHPIANSLTADRPILLTGSNASGKSTFLKAAALCALMAQTIGFCPAEAYEGSIYRIRSSMALRDSIRSGESYFMVEIRSLKRIADLSDDGGRPVLCCIDEVLRGTNTVERIAASSEILKTLAKRQVLCFAATHDIELASLLEDAFMNYHFEEELDGGDVVFSYQLKKGRATTRNAIRLLAAVGFEPEITKQAGRRAEQFEQTGQWK